MPFRYTRGEVNERRVRVESAHVVEIGDLVFLDTDSMRPVTDLSTFASVTLMQIAVHTLFAGVALHRKVLADGDTVEFLIATSGIFGFINGAAAAIEMGALIGVDGDGSNQPLNQTVIAADTPLPAEAIGRCAQRIAATDTVVQVEIVSTIYGIGGMQAVVV